MKEKHLPLGRLSPKTIQNPFVKFGAILAKSFQYIIHHDYHMDLKIKPREIQLQYHSIFENFGTQFSEVCNKHVSIVHIYHIDMTMGKSHSKPWFGTANTKRVLGAG